MHGFTLMVCVGYNATNLLEALVGKLLSATLLVTSMLTLCGLGIAQAPPAPDPDKPYQMEYYYKTHWGHQEEFLELFKKNHYPVLEKEIAQGRILSVRLDTPAYHMPEQERWDYRVTIVFKNAQAAFTPLDEHAIQLLQLLPLTLSEIPFCPVRKLFPIWRKLVLWLRENLGNELKSPRSYSALAGEEAG